MSKISRLQGTSCIIEYLYKENKRDDIVRETVIEDYTNIKYEINDRDEKILSNCINRRENGKCKLERREYVHGECENSTLCLDFLDRRYININNVEKTKDNKKDDYRQQEMKKTQKNTVLQNQMNSQKNIHISPNKIEEKLNLILNFYFSRAIKFNESNGFFTLKTLEGEKLKFIPYDILQEIYRDKNSSNKYKKLKELCKD